MIAEWVDAYITRLPPELRPSGSDQRFVAAARTAVRNGWRPDVLASLIVGRSDYSRKRNPRLVAVLELEEAGGRPPPAAGLMSDPRRRDPCTEHAAAVALDLTRNQCRACRADG